MTASELATNKAQTNRGTLFVEDAEVIAVTSFPGQQFITRLASPKCAVHAVAGSFVHLQCDEAIQMRRPLSIMRANAAEGWIDVLYKIVGEGLRALASKKAGDYLSVIGPIGHGFTPSPERPKTLLIGGGVGIPPMVFLAETLKDSDTEWQPLVLMGSEIPFPFELKKSEIATSWLPDDASGSAALLKKNWRRPKCSPVAQPPCCKRWPTWQGNTTFPARWRSKNSWLAGSADAPAAQCWCKPTRDRR